MEGHLQTSGLDQAQPLTEMPDMGTVYNAINAALSESNEGKLAATSWLESLRNSIYAWKICDDILIARQSQGSCYIAANILRRKITKQFNELPLDCYGSLKDSLMNHLESIDDTSVRNQLGLSLVYLSILLQQWKNPIEDIASRLNLQSSLLQVQADALGNLDTINKIQASLKCRETFSQLLTLMSEETACSSSPVKVGVNRREEYEEYLLSDSDKVIDWMLSTLSEMSHIQQQIFLASNKFVDQQQQQKEFKECMRLIDKLIGAIYQTYSAWLRFFSPVMALRCLPIIESAFGNLRDLDCCETLHDHAVSAIVATSETFESSDDHHELIDRLIEATYTLENAYMRAVTTEDTSKLINYTRVFTDIAEAACVDYILRLDKLKLVELVLKCINHFDFEVAETTFGFWWRFGEEIQMFIGNGDYSKYIPYIEQLIMGLIKLCHCDPDDDCVLTSAQELYGFRTRVCELIKSVIFIPTAAGFIQNCKLLELLESSNLTQNDLSQNQQQYAWERIEAILFLFTCLLDEIEDETVSVQIKQRLFNYIINSQLTSGQTDNLQHCKFSNNVKISIGCHGQNQIQGQKLIHPQVVDSACKLLSVMDTFLRHQTSYLPAAINYLLAVFQQYQRWPRLAQSSSSALVSIIHECGKHCGLADNTELIQLFTEICVNLDSIKCEPAGANMIRCCASLMSSTSLSEIRDECLCRLVRPNILSLIELCKKMTPNDLMQIESNSENIPSDDSDTVDLDSSDATSGRGKPITPMIYLDRITNLFRDLNVVTNSTNNKTTNNNNVINQQQTDVTKILPNLCNLITQDLWSALLQVLHHFAPGSEAIIERTCRTIRYVVRSIRPRWMVQTMAHTMINLYATYPKNSSPLYVGSILVDEFANLDGVINECLFKMLERFCEMTFALIQMSGTQAQSLLTMKTYPDTIEDMMRLFRRFIQKCPHEFVACPAIDSIMELSISSLRLDQREAHETVVRFIESFIRLGQSPQQLASHQATPSNNRHAGQSLLYSERDDYEQMSSSSSMISHGITPTPTPTSTPTPPTPTQQLSGVGQSGGIQSSLNQDISNGQQQQQPLVPQVAHALRDRNLGYRIADAVIRASIYNLPSYYVVDLAEILVELAKFDGQLYAVWIDHVVASLPETKVQGLVSVTQQQKNELKQSLLLSPCDSKRVVAALRYLVSLFH